MVLKCFSVRGIAGIPESVRKSARWTSAVWSSTTSRVTLGYSNDLIRSCAKPETAVSRTGRSSNHTTIATSRVSGSRLIKLR